MQRKIFRFTRVALATALGAAMANAQADAITDWNVKSGEIVTEAKLGTPPAVRVMAVVQTAAYEAARGAGKDASIEAAIASAHRVTLSKLIPSQQALVDNAYNAALATVAEGPAKAAGIALGEKAAASVLASRADDAIAAESYRPHTTAGMYVPTASAAAPQWGSRKTWLMTGPAQFRPAAPPALESSTWARDYNEVRTMGARASTMRTSEQTEIARFWEYSLPSIYHGVVRSVANAPGRDLVRNARLFAAVAQAMDDALIGVFEAKYAYNFWRPTTAIRNGDIDNNPATDREATWMPLLDAPMHPEYPSGHSILATTVAAVIYADVGTGAVELSTSSPSAKGAVRKWTNLDEFAREVGEARIYAGIHYRSAVDAGCEMGKQIGRLAAQKVLHSTEAVAAR